MADRLFMPAVRERVPLLVAFAGASGTGKTRTALRVACGLVGGDMRKVYLIDTENRRGLHHVDAFAERYHYAELRPPFTPERFGRLCAAAVEEGAGAIVVDSFSDEMEGEGGLLDMADQSPISGAGAWAGPKAAHKAFMRQVRLASVHIIFCLRAEERVRLEPDPERPRKTRVVPMGWMPICEKRLMFEMGLSLTFAPDTPGRPRFDLPHKLPDFFAPLFPPDRVIDESVGEAMAAWARGDLLGETKPPPEEDLGEQPAKPADAARTVVDDLIARLQAAGTVQEYFTLIDDEKVGKQLAWLKAKRPALHSELATAMRENHDRVNTEPVA